MFQGGYTSAAFKAMVEKPQDREAPARELVEAFGGTLHHIFFCMGTDDVVALIEAPDDEAMATGAMVLAASGAFAGAAGVGGAVLPVGTRPNCLPRARQ